MNNFSLNEMSELSLDELDEASGGAIFFAPVVAVLTTKISATSGFAALVGGGIVLTAFLAGLANGLASDRKESAQ